MKYLASVLIAVALIATSALAQSPPNAASLMVPSGGFPLYSSGSWTPGILANGTPGTPVYSTQVGTYEIIGRQVTARFTVQISGWTGSPTGTVQVTGLPVASGAAANDLATCAISLYTVTGLAASNFGITGFVSNGTQNVILEQNGTTGTTTITVAQFGTGSQTIVGVCNYHT